MTEKQCPRCNARFKGDAKYCPMDGNRLKELVDPLIGRVIGGRYLIEEKLSSGGMGMVYRCRHTVINRDVAIKFLLPVFSRDKVYRHRFLVEARVANQINHEHIVDITDFGETDDGFVYMVMEYLRGRSLGREIAYGPIPVRRAIHIAIQIVQGLARAHDLGVIHRDIKPDNVFLITGQKDSDFVKLLDFGVARLAQELHITTRGTVLGTPEYMSPEQVRGTELTASTDLYSVGCVLFEMLTGRIPFEGQEAVRVVKQMSEPPPLPSTRLSSIPQAVDEIVVKLLQKKPEGRHRDAHHLLENLQEIMQSLEGGPYEPSSISDLVPTHRFSERPVSLQNNEEQLRARVVLYRKLIADKYQTREAPRWLVSAVDRIETVAAELVGLREKLSTAAKTATEQEDEARSTRIRVGNALDVLTRDESKLQRDIESLGIELEKLRSEVHRILDEVVNSSKSVPTGITTGISLTETEVTSLNQLVQKTRAMAELKEAIQRTNLRLSEKQNELDDLRFQIAQLKGRLGTTNAESLLNKDAIQHETYKIDSTLQTRIESIMPEAERILLHFIEDPQYRHLVAEHVSIPPMSR
jgi:serine/threonine protein kinase